MHINPYPQEIRLSQLCNFRLHNRMDPCHSFRMEVILLYVNKTFQSCLPKCVCWECDHGMHSNGGGGNNETEEENGVINEP